AEEIAVIAAHMRDLGVTAETGEWPVERTHQPGRTVPLTGKRRAAPLIRRVEQPDAGEVERRSNRGDLRQVRRTRPHEPATREVVERGHKRQRRVREKAEAGVA